MLGHMLPAPFWSNVRLWPSNERINEGLFSGIIHKKDEYERLRPGLPFEPLMAVLDKLQAPRAITTDFHEALAPIGVIQIEVVLVGQGRFMACKFKDGPFTGRR
jgi:hypothetical protein